MARAFENFWMVPHEYFSLVFHLSLLTDLSAFLLCAGYLGLLLGTAVGLVRRERQLLLFFLPFCFSQLFAVFTGLMFGRFREGDFGNLILISFLALQAALIGFLLYRTRKAWMGAIPLAAFSATYAITAAIFGGMALANDGF
ncbi:MAG: hypothetical protein ABJL17_05925 [Parvibaculum sp.]|uniref:hypothetical protein n=1 Tax=Parvibaculum sp. TaxID=2024848 RepID=UPI0032656C37